MDEIGGGIWCGVRKADASKAGRKQVSSTVGRFCGDFVG